MSDDTSSDEQGSLARRSVRGGLMAVGVVFLLIGAGWWIAYIRETADGFTTEKINAQFFVLGFLFWLFPTLIGCGMMTSASGARRKHIATIVWSIFAVFLITAIVTTIVGARPPTPS